MELATLRDSMLGEWRPAVRDALLSNVSRFLPIPGRRLRSLRWALSIHGFFYFLADIGVASFSTLLHVHAGRQLLLKHVALQLLRLHELI